MLDIISDGRAMFGIGRGLSRREYDLMNIPMDESRGRFDESAEIILRALETGELSASGEFWNRPSAPVRPAPIRSFRDRVVSVAMSPDSALQAAKLGVGIVMFSQKPAEASIESVANYRQAFRENHGREAPTIRFCDFTYCHPDSDTAAQIGYENCAAYYSQVMQHYELMGDHFAKMKGYSSYGADSAMLREIGLEAQARGYFQAQAGGTPAEIIGKLQKRRELLGPTDTNICFKFSSLTADQARASMELFAKEVLPELRSWG